MTAQQRSLLAAANDWTGADAANYASGMSEFSPEMSSTDRDAAWRRLVAKTLGGDAPERLTAILDTGAYIEPLYTAAEAGELARASGHPGTAPYVRGVSAETGWQVLQPLWGEDPGAINMMAREGLAGGADALWLEVAGDDHRGGVGIEAGDLAGMEQMLAGIPLDETPVYIAPGGGSLPTAALLVALARKQGIARGKLSGALGLDPLSDIAARGEAPVRDERALADAVDAALFARSEELGMIPLVASGRVWHQAGGSAVEELACSLAAAVAYWRALAEQGVAADEAARMIGFHLTADADVFLSMAKFRAARALWARATEAAGITPQPASITGEMSCRTMAARDEYNNLLRGTAAAFAAVTGGAQAVLVFPFNTPSGTMDAFATRLARNTLNILAEESGLGRVVDAAGGSWYVETLTYDLAAQAWNLFQEIESEGDLLTALRSGLVARRLAAVRARRDNWIARRERAITGVSTYPNPDEHIPLPARGMQNMPAGRDDGPIADLPPSGDGVRMAAMVDAASQGATGAALSAALYEPWDPVPLLPEVERRDPEDFEDLRAASDAALSLAGVRPTVFLANIGRLAAFTERATWARNFFAAGGIISADSPGYDDVPALVEGFRDSGATIACLCGADEGYAAMGGAASALERAGAQAVYLTGTAMSLEAVTAEDIRAIGRVLHDGCDALAILREADDLLSVKEVLDAARERSAPEAGSAAPERDEG